MTFAFSSLSDSHVSAFTFDGMVDGPIQMGPTDMVDDLRADRPDVFFFLDLECARQSSGRLLGHFQINYPRSSPIIGMRRCVESAP